MTVAHFRSATSITHSAGACPWEGGPDGAFWSAAIGSGAAAIAQLCDHVDSMSERIGRLPVRPNLTRPVVGQYLTMLRTLASAWGMRTRPALVGAMGSLAHFGASVGQPLTCEALAARRADRAQAALRALDALLRRLAAPRAAFEALDADFGSYLTQMATASRRLDADTLLVTQRLEADGVHAFLLSQQASTLQSKLDDATARADAWWLLGPHAGPLRQEICLHGAALEGVRRQLDQLRAEQATTRDEAEYLQSLLPTLSTYLAAVDRMGAAIGAVGSGIACLHGTMADLKGRLALQPGLGGEPELQLGAAVAHWREVGLAAARVPGSAKISSPGGYPP